MSLARNTCQSFYIRYMHRVINTLRQPTAGTPLASPLRAGSDLARVKSNVESQWLALTTSAYWGSPGLEFQSQDRSLAGGVSRFSSVIMGSAQYLKETRLLPLISFRVMG
jgi:hypothetical protein